MSAITVTFYPSDKPRPVAPPGDVLPKCEQPINRIHALGPANVSNAELISAILGAKNSSLGEFVLAQFGGLLGLRRVGTMELEEIEGIGPASAVRLRAALELGKRAAITQPEDRPRINSPADAAAIVMADLSASEQEELWVLLLDVRNRVLGIEVICRGSLDTTLVRVGDLFRQAIRTNSAKVLLCHNHPSGDPSPSPEDLALTRTTVEAGKMLGVEVVDHLVIGQQRFVSLKEQGGVFNV